LKTVEGVYPATLITIQRYRVAGTSKTRLLGGVSGEELANKVLDPTVGGLRGWPEFVQGLGDRKPPSS
jgi:hypothetical protein